MKYILEKDYRLRGWTDSVANIERIYDRKLIKLTPHECLFLMKCDGQRDIEPDEFAAEQKHFTELGIIRVTDGDVLLPDQEYKLYENKKFRTMNLSITGSCDFRCRHCFNAEDDRPRGLTPATEDILSLIRRMDECGVANLWINGGEPLLNKDFLKITAELKKYGIIFDTLVSNIYHMTPDIVDELIKQGHSPVIYVSFDGLGQHEWLRGIAGSEQRTLDNIRMLKDKGFVIHVHTCVWKDSLPSLGPTMLKLQELGVDQVRITCIEPSLRWVAHNKDQSIAPRDWLDFVTDFLKWWYSEKIDMDLDIWGFWLHRKGSDRVKIIPDNYANHERDYNIPICSDGYNRPFIDCDGRIVLCLGLTGVSKALGMEWGNVYTDDLAYILREGAFIRLFKENTLGDMKASDEECSKCEWREYCNLGCRTEAIVQGNGIRGRDERMCIFFKEGYYLKFKEIARNNNLVVG
jgi:Arylsulfatase regulator (Fe-S oxidoreductase)